MGKKFRLTFIILAVAVLAFSLSGCSDFKEDIEEMLAKPIEFECGEFAPSTEDLSLTVKAYELPLLDGEWEPFFDPRKIRIRPVCESSTDLDAALVEAAMRIPAAGNISPVIETEGGYVIIEYVEDIAEHAATLEEVREQLHDEALTNKKNAAYTAAVAQWESEADVKIYRENLSL